MKLKWLFSTTVIALIIVVGLIGMAGHDSAVAAHDGSSKIEALLLDQLSANGSADFIIVMAEQSDVSAASQMQSKLEKGQYVFDTLVATADRTQADLLSYLDSRSATYESYYILNAIVVRSGSLDLALNIANRADVAYINANHIFQLEKTGSQPETTVRPFAIEGKFHLY